MSIRCITVPAAILLLALTIPQADATTVCASTMIEVSDAIASAATDDTDMDIRIVAGDYTLEGAGFDNADKPSKGSLSLQGGYNADCTSHTSGGATTKLYADNPGGLRLSSYGNLHLRDLTFSGLQLDSELTLRGSESDDLIVERVAFIDTFSVPLVVQMDASESGRISLQNDLFVGSNNPAGCVLTLSGSKGSALIANNTIAHSTADMGLCLQGQMGKRAHSNIVWDISGTDIVNSGSSLLSVRNIYGELTGTLQIGSIGNSSGDPLFAAPGSGDFALAAGSPAINSGGTYLPGGLGSLDLQGATRIEGSQVDRGALESTTNDLLTLVVDNIGDGAGVSGDAGTLRRAIFDANSVGVPARIVFQIPGGCGVQQIVIDRLLPVIAVPLIIDGTTQSGSTSNTSVSAFNAQICVVIAASTAGPAVDQAMYVFSPDQTSVTIRGLGFSGFVSPLIFASGSGHRVLGNQFGGVLPDGPGQLSLKPNNISVAFSGTSKDSIIGGTSLEDRNLIAGEDGFTGIGILLGGGTSDSIEARNNMIGMDRSGLVAAALGQGIVAVNNGHLIVDNRIGGAITTGIRLATATNVVVQNNDVGGALPNGFGIVLNAGSSLNTIGATAANTGRGNRIINNIGGGVLVDSTAGIFNRVRDNELTVVESPLGDDAMVLDLGAQGADPNDPGDGDNGPNSRLNYPVLGNLLSEANTITLSAAVDVPVGSYVLDLYAADRCLSNGRAMAKHKVLTSSFSIFQPLPQVVTLMLGVEVGSPAHLGATLTNGGGDTSELSNCVDVDSVFVDGFE